MSRRNPSTGFPTFSPNRQARHWTEKGAAYLRDLFTVPVTYEIHTTNPAGTSQLVLRRVDDVTMNLSPPGERPAINLLADTASGSHPAVTELVGKVVKVSCMPPPELITGGRKAEPYKDMLFLNGELELTLPAHENGEVIEQVRTLGRVASLSMITPEGVLPVWPARS